MTTENLPEELQALLDKANAEIAAADAAGLENLRVGYLGKKGLITEQLKKLGTLPDNEKPVLTRASISSSKRFRTRSVTGSRYWMHQRNRNPLNVIASILPCQGEGSARVACTRLPGRWIVCRNCLAVWVSR